MCKLWLVMDYLLCTASVFNIVLISYDRFLSVTKAVSTLFIVSLSFVARLWDLARPYLDIGDKPFALLVSTGPRLIEIVTLRKYACVWR